MPVIHLYGGLVETRQGFLNKKKKISAINDTSVLDSGVEPRNATSLAMSADNYYVFGYWFWEKPLLVVMLFLFCIGLTAIVATFGVNGRWEFFILGLICLIVLRQLWRYSFIHKFKKFVIFDKRTGIIHIPKRFGREYDRVLFKDASFIIVDRIHYLGISKSTYFYLLRPGWDLIHDGWIKHTFSLIELSKLPDPYIQKVWAYLVQFMVGKLDSLDSMKEAKKVYKRFSKFDPSKFGTDLTWTRDEDGKWHKVKSTK